MNRLLKWLGIACGALAILALGAVAGLYIVSERIVQRTYERPLSAIALPIDAVALAEGRRLATIRGCYDGCHGKQLDGGVLVDKPFLARLVAPNLTQVAAQHTDAELERVIRHGIRRDGKSTLAMPSAMFYHLSDADLAAIIAFIRSAPVTYGPSTEISLGPLARFGIVMGKYSPQAMMIDHDAPRLAVRDDPVVIGNYLALTSCTECHGTDLRGAPDGFAPSLVIASTYSEQDFARLMRTGIAAGDRELDLMARVARSRFSHFTEAEVRALHAFLGTLDDPPTERTLQ
jgi:mono/diheme cytochrome c family protein